MIHLIDADEGCFGSGQFPEAEALACGVCDRVWALGPRTAALDGIVTPERWVPRRRSRFRAAEAPPLAPVRAWGREPARWALQQRAGNPLSVALLEGPLRPGRSARVWAAKIGMFRDIILYDRADADAWMAAGIPEARLRLEQVRVDRPLLARERRDALREELELEPDEHLIMPLAAPWHALDAQHFVFLLGMLRVHGWRVCGLLPAGAWRLAGARAFRNHSGLETRLIVIDGPMSPWLAACDAAYLDAARPRDRLLAFLPRGALRVLIMAAETAGVPVAIAPGSLVEASPTRAPSVADEVRSLIRILEMRDRIASAAAAANTLG